MITFGEDQIDTLKEIFNISYSLATALITNTAGCSAKLHTPEIDVQPMDQIKKQIEALPFQNRELLIMDQKYQGALSGESLLFVEKSAARMLASLMLDEDVCNISDEDASSCALELANILTSASIGKLAELLSSHISFNAPGILSNDIENVVAGVNTEEFRNFFVVKTWLETDIYNITGYLFIFIKEESFTFLHQAIDEFIENYG